MGRKKKPTPIELLRAQFDAFKRTGKAGPPLYRAVVCYVCKCKGPRQNMRYIGKNKDGDDVYRHEHCEVGTASWFKHAAPDNKFRKLYRTYPPDSDQQENGDDH